MPTDSIIATGLMEYDENDSVLLVFDDNEESGINFTLPGREGSIGENSMLPEHVYVGMGIYLSVTGVLALIANVIVMLIFVRHQHLRVAKNLHLLNLSVAEVGMVLLAFPLAIRSNFARKWLYGRVGCQWYGFSGFLFGNASMSTLTFLSFDRYLTVCRPNSDLKLRNMSGAIKVLIFIWSEALLFAGLPILGWSEYNFEPFQTSCTKDWYNHSVEAISFIFCLTLFIGVNVTIIIFCYGSIVYKVRVHGKTNSLAKSRGKAGDQKTTILISLQVIGFLVCWMPYAITSLWLSYGGTSEPSITLSILPAMFTKFSPLLNPLLHVAVNYNFRRAFVDIVRCKFTKHPKKLNPIQDKQCLRITISPATGGYLDMCLYKAGVCAGASSFPDNCKAESI